MRAVGRTQCMRYGGGQTQIRTGDTRIFSPLLYRLSYLATVYLHSGGLRDKFTNATSNHAVFV